MMDQDSLSEGELEDGEVLSSEEEEEGQGDTKEQLPGNSAPAREVTPARERKENEESGEAKDRHSEGEINSDDEEAAYYPHRVRRHSSRDRSLSRDRSRRERSRSNQRGSSSERGGSRRKDRSRSRSRRRSPRHRVRSSDEDDQDSLRHEKDGSSAHSRDCYSSPRRSSRRDGGGRSAEGDDSVHHHGSHFSNKGTRGRRFGGYGQTHTYQQRGAKYTRGGGRGANYGGYANRSFHGRNEGREEKQMGSEDVVARLQKGMSLLPPPKEPQCGNLDQFNYPAPPSWYLQEVEEWEGRELTKVAVKGAGLGDDQEGISVEQGVGVPGQGHVPGHLSSPDSVMSPKVSDGGSAAMEVTAVSPSVAPGASSGALGLSVIPGANSVVASNFVPAVTPGANNFMPAVAPGADNFVPAVVPGADNFVPAVAPGAHNFVPAVAPGASNFVSAVAPGADNFVPAVVPGAHNFVPAVAPGADNVVVPALSPGAFSVAVGVVSAVPVQSMAQGGPTSQPTSQGGPTSQPTSQGGPTSQPTSQGVPPTIAESDSKTMPDATVQSTIPIILVSPTVSSFQPHPSNAAPTSAASAFYIAPADPVCSFSRGFDKEGGATLEEGGGGEEDMEVCPVSPVPVILTAAAPTPGYAESGNPDAIISKEVKGQVEGVVSTGGSVAEDIVSSSGGVASEGCEFSSAAGVVSSASGEGIHTSVGVAGKGGVAGSSNFSDLGVSSEPSASEGCVVSGGGVVDERGTSDKSKVNVQEQLIKLSEIAHVEVYVAPVTEPSPAAMEPHPFQQEVAPSRQEVTPSQREAPPSKQEATPSQQEVVLSQQAAASTQVTRSSPREPTPTPSQVSEVTNSLSLALEGEVALTSEQQGCGLEEPVYSLRSKKGKPAKPVGKKAAPALPKVVPSDSGEINYDDYLDQLVEEEEEPVGGLSLSNVVPVLPGNFPLEDELGHAPTLDEELSEDFPVINGARREAKEETLQSLVGVTSGSVSMASRKKSMRRRQKEGTWWARQKEKDQLSAERERGKAEKFKKSQCKYYLNGYCKNGDVCDFSHEGTPRKKKDICKFYLMDSCMKGTNCIFYHGDFPCKFFHTKKYCKNGDQCKFSHAPLTLDTRDLLLSVLDGGVNSEDLVVSIPQEVVAGTDEDSLVVSVPFSKLVDKHRLKFFSIPKLQLAVGGISAGGISAGGISAGEAGHILATVPTQQLLVGGSPRGQGSFQFAPGTQDQVLLNSIPSQQSNQSLPVPLFPPKDLPTVVLSSPYVIPGSSISPTLPPPPPMAVPPTAIPAIGENSQRKVLLPTPPSVMKLLPDDFKKLSQQDYWENTMSGAAPPPAQVQGQYAQEAMPKEMVPHPPQHKEGTQYQGAPPQGPPGPTQYHAPLVHQKTPPQQPVFLPPQQTVHRPPEQAFHRAPEQLVQRTPQQSLHHSPQQSLHRPPQQPLYPAPHHPLHHPPHLPPQQPFQQPRYSNPNPGMGPNRMPLSRMEPRPAPGMGVKWISETPRMDPRQRSHPDDTSGQRQWQQWNHPSPNERSFAGPAPYADSARLPSAPPPGFQVPPLSAPDGEQQHQQVLSSSPLWATSGRSPEQRSPVNHHGGGGVGGGVIREERRVDPRTKYSHLKIKPKGSSSPSQSSSVLKRAGNSSSPAPSFKTPKLLQDSAALDRPIDPRDLFKGIAGSAESVYEDVAAAPFGMFKSNFFPRSQPPLFEEGSEPAKRAFGEITLEGVSSQDPRGSAQTKGGRRKGTEPSDIETPAKRDEVSMLSPKEDSPQPPSVPSYLAQLDVGLGSDLKIDSAFGSLAEDGKSDGGKDKEGEGSQARKLPSMFGLGF